MRRKKRLGRRSHVLDGWASEESFGDPVPGNAGSVYEVLMESEAPGLLVRFFRAAWASVVMVFDVTEILDEQPKSPATVYVIRRSDGKVVAEYRYRDAREAFQHGRSIQERLPYCDVGRFNEELGIDPQ